MIDRRAEPTLGAEDSTNPAPVEEGLGSAVPLTGDVPPPPVKRFSRRAAGAVAGAVALVTALAIGHGLGHRPVGKPAPEPTAQSAPANPATSDTINGLPGSYADPKLARGVPPATGMPPGTGTPSSDSQIKTKPNPPGWSLGDLSTAQVPVTRAETSDREKNEIRIREAGFSFAGGGTMAAREEPSGVRAPVIPMMPPGFSGGSAGPSTAGRDDDNRQDDKAAFLEKARSNRWGLKESVEHPASPYTLLSGTVLPGVLITGIDSDLPGQIEGQISQNVYDTVTGRYLLLPQGTKLIGSYDSRITYGQSRVLIVWTRVIRPDGSSLDLEGMPGVDLSGYAGVTGRVDRHMSRLLTAVLLGSLIQAGTSAGTSYVDPTFSDRARQGTGQGVNDATQQLVRKELQLQPTIEVAPGSRFNVFTTKDLVIPPYAG
jgi:type IV secretion system protein TrbI